MSSSNQKRVLVFFAKKVRIVERLKGERFLTLNVKWHSTILGKRKIFCFITFFVF